MVAASLTLVVEVPQTAELPHSALNPVVDDVPQSAELPHSAELPQIVEVELTNTFVPQSAEVPQRAELPHNAEFPNNAELSLRKWTHWYEESKLEILECC
jgi:hypothetical protein